MRLVGSGGGQVGVEEVLLRAGVGCQGGGFLFGRGGDDGQEGELSDGGTRDVDALGVGAGIGWGQEEAGIVDEVVKEGDVRGGEALEQVAGGEGEAEPEAFRSEVVRGRCGG